MVKISFIAKRRVGYYFIKVYFPGTLCTVVSWLAFWMDPENIGDRGTVGITSLLTQMFLVQSVNEHMPHVNYVKATDLFLIVSFVFSFITLLESITVYRAAKGGKMEMNASPQNERVWAYFAHSNEIQNCLTFMSIRVRFLFRASLRNRNRAEITMSGAQGHIR